MTIKHEDRLSGVHPDLIRIVREAVKTVPFEVTIIQGTRTPEQQAKNVKAGKSQTSRSRHVVANNRCGFACAVDMAPMLTDGTIPWKDWKAFQALDAAMKKAAAALKIPMEWGGDWKTLKDGDHWQLPWKAYP